MRRTELFSLRRTPDEVAELNSKARELYKRLDEDTFSHIITKTEVDRNPKRICDAFTDSIEADDSCEQYIFANAIDTEDSSSFVDCFAPMMSLIEDAMDCCKAFTKDDGTKAENHINIYSFYCKGTDIKGYCFYAIGKRFIMLPAFETVKDVKFTDFVADAVKSAEQLLEEKMKLYPNGVITLDKANITYVKSKGKAKNFFLSFIPCKGDKASDIIRKILVLVAIGVFIAGAVILLNFYVFMPVNNQVVISEIQEIYYSTTDEVIYATNDEGEVIVIEGSDKNWPGLKKVNEEIVAWVKINGTKIDYPVLEHKGDNNENQFYLYRNYKKDYSDFGSIFVDYRCLDSVKSKNLILHGHNMGSDDSMFGQLMNYARKDGRTAGNEKFYKKSPLITIDTPEGSDEYIIFSLMKIDVSNELDTVFDYLKADFDSDARFMNFIYNIKIRSYLSVDVPINEDDTLLTLSTCSYETQNMRTIAVARKVRDNEDVSEYIKNVSSASPVTIASSSFSVENAAKNTPWYDGKGNLEGDETVEYMRQSKTYVVEFFDGNGKVINTQIIIEGRDAKAPKEAPRKTADGTYYYVFKGWDTDFTDVTKNLKVKPVFTKKKMPTATKPTTEPTTTVVTEAPYVPPETEYDEPTEAPTQPPVTEPKETQPPVVTTPPTEAPTQPPVEEATTAIIATPDPTEAPAPETTTP